MTAWAAALSRTCHNNPVVVYCYVMRPKGQYFWTEPRFGLSVSESVSTVALLASSGTVNYGLFRRGGVTCSGLCSGLEAPCNILHDCTVCGGVGPCYQICLCHHNISLCKFTAVIYDMIKVKMEMVMSSLTHQIAASTKTLDDTAMVDDS